MIALPDQPARSYTLLLVEDNQINARLMTTVMESRGHKVIHAENGQIALDMLHQQPYDLIIMDMQMPVMDGVAATRAIRAMDGPIARIPIIGLTADATEGGRAIYENLDLNCFLTKPVDWPELTRALEEHAARPDLQGATAQTHHQPADAGDDPLIDQAFYDDLMAALPADRIGDILASFYSTCPQLLAQIENQLAAGDRLAAAKTCHSLAGQALGFGATLLGQTCKQAEIALKDGQSIDLAALRDIHDRTLTQMKARQSV